MDGACDHADRPGDQAGRDSADEVHRQGCCYACCDATTGLSGSHFGEDCGSPAGKVRRCGCAREDHAVDGTTGHSASDCAEDQESPAGAVHERMHVQIADVPIERISERMHEQIVDVPVPQKIKENVEPGSRDSGRLWWCNDRFLSFKLW